MKGDDAVLVVRINFDGILGCVKIYRWVRLGASTKLSALCYDKDETS